MCSSHKRTAEWSPFFVVRRSLRRTSGRRHVCQVRSRDDPSVFSSSFFPLLTAAAASCINPELILRDGGAVWAASLQLATFSFTCLLNPAQKRRTAVELPKFSVYMVERARERELEEWRMSRARSARANSDAGHSLSQDSSTRARVGAMRRHAHVKGRGRR